MEMRSECYKMKIWECFVFYFHTKKAEKNDLVIA